MCLIYNILIPMPSIGGIALESITITSAAIGIARQIMRKPAAEAI